MIRLSQQELEICYILSGIFNYYTSYAKILDDINQDVANYKTGEKHYARYAYLVGKKECFALFRVRRKYKRVVGEIKAIKSDFAQKDLDRLFPITTLYCIRTPLFYDALEAWAMEEGWNKVEFMRGIIKIKDISYFRRKYIAFRTKYHYKIVCCVFGFTQHSLEEQKQLLKQDNSIHLPTQYDKYMYAVCCIAFILVFIVWIVKVMG